jgi:hypothetical protein
MKTLHQITEAEFQVFLSAIKNVIGNPSGCWHDKSTLEFCSGENCTSMCIDTFTDQLRRKFIIKG